MWLISIPIAVILLTLAYLIRAIKYSPTEEEYFRTEVKEVSMYVNENGELVFDEKIKTKEILN